VCRGEEKQSAVGAGVQRREKFLVCGVPLLCVSVCYNSIHFREASMEPLLLGVRVCNQREFVREDAGHFLSVPTCANTSLYEFTARCYQPAGSVNASCLVR
jgi:hypothetical protein